MQRTEIGKKRTCGKCRVCRSSFTYPEVEFPGTIPIEKMLFCSDTCRESDEVAQALDPPGVDFEAKEVSFVDSPMFKEPT